MSSRAIARHREYKSCTIWHEPMPGKLPWTATTCYRMVAADTLAGIKRLISADMDLSTKRKVA